MAEKTFQKSLRLNEAENSKLEEALLVVDPLSTTNSFREQIVMLANRIISDANGGGVSDSVLNSMKETIEKLQKSALENIDEINSLREKNEILRNELEKATNSPEIRLEIDEKDNKIAELSLKVIEQSEIIADYESRKPEIKEVIKEKPLTDTQLLLELSPKEKYLLTEVSKFHEITPKELLMDRFFMTYQYHGAGDYKIARISKAKRDEIDAYFSKE